MAKDKQRKRKGRTGGGAEDGGGPRELRLADHPRATGQIRTVRSWAALAAFVFVLVFSGRAGIDLEGSLLRALQAGLVGYLVAWAAMVMIWRQLAQAELEIARRRIVAAMREIEAEREGGTA